MNFSTSKTPAFKYISSGTLSQKKIITLYCSYDNNYQEIYEPVYDQNIIFYDEEEFDFEVAVRHNLIDFYEA